MLLPQEHTVMVRQTSKWGKFFYCRWWDWVRQLSQPHGSPHRRGDYCARSPSTPKGGVEVKSPITSTVKGVVSNGDSVTKGDSLLRYDVNAARNQSDIESTTDNEEDRIVSYEAIISAKKHLNAI